MVEAPFRIVLDGRFVLTVCEKETDLRSSGFNLNL
jgi:hypothetical protein